MAHTKKIVVGAINIKTHPHTPEKYSEMMMSAYEMNRILKLRGMDYGMIGSMHPFNKDNHADGFWGTVYRFINIDPEEQWLDLTKRKPVIQEEDAKPIVPDHLKPHLRQASFVFLPRGHRLFFDVGRISHGLMELLLLGLFTDHRIQKKYGQVDVHIEKSEEAIDAILSIPQKSELMIYITKPNPDDLSQDRQEVLDRLLNQNARSLEERLKGPREPGIVPDAQTRILMDVAQSNGRVEATGYDGKRRITRSTERHPLTEVDYYDQDQQTVVDKLLEMARKIMNDLRRN